MKLIVGLGNPGKKYDQTRHNVGFILLDKYASNKKLSWKLEKKFKCELTKAEDVIFAKPQTFMNKSGVSVSKLVDYFKIDLEDLLVVHDDVDFSLGESRPQFGRGAAGHKGVQSIIDSLGNINFWRQRIGIGRPIDPNKETDDWVLEPLTKLELSQIEAFVSVVDAFVQT